MPDQRIEKTDEEWRAILTPEQYRIAREGGTEPAFTGAYWNEKAAGAYHCACCDQPLYRSDAKFDSGSGWPSFWDTCDEHAVQLRTDESQGTVRIEALCSRCGAHLGHVFGDGPQPTGQRHCINSASLRLVEPE